MEEGYEMLRAGTHFTLRLLKKILRKGEKQATALRKTITHQLQSKRQGNERTRHMCRNRMEANTLDQPA